MSKAADQPDRNCLIALTGNGSPRLTMCARSSICTSIEPEGETRISWTLHKRLSQSQLFYNSLRMRKVEYRPIEPCLRKKIEVEMRRKVMWVLLLNVDLVQ